MILFLGFLGANICLLIFFLLLTKNIFWSVYVDQNLTYPGQFSYYSEDIFLWDYDLEIYDSENCPYCDTTMRNFADCYINFVDLIS